LTEKRNIERPQAAAAGRHEPGGLGVTRTRREFLTTALQVAGGLALAACAPAAPTAPAAAQSAAPAAAKKGGMLVVGDWTDDQTADPAFNAGFPGRRVERTLFDPLVDVDVKGNILPTALAESWETPDPRTYVFHLRKGIKFHDGTDFNAEAVKFHFDRHLDPKVKSRRNGELIAVDNAQVVDPYTVKVSLKTPYAAFLASLYDWAGFIVSPAAVQKWGNDNFGVHPVGTGPFKFVSYTGGQSWVVERNGDYWQKDKPALDGVTWKIIPVDATRLVELRSGGVHIAELLPFQDVERMRQMNDIVLSESKGYRLHWSRWNADSPYGKSPEFRQAMQWIIDRDLIHKSVYFETGNIGFDAFFPNSGFYDPAYKPFTRDLAKAKALLDKAQVPQPAKFTIYIGTDAVYQKLTQVYQQNFADLGITVDIQVETGAAATARSQSGNWTLETNGGWGYRPDAAQYIATNWISNTNYYLSGTLKDSQLDNLIVQGQTETDPPKRYQTYRQLAARMNELSGSVFDHHASDFKGLGPKVKGFVHFPDGTTRYKDVSLE
jgi:peptide/nickel transport system substrate-binding protein